MILTCPACGTQYVVKDGAIPPGGRQVRCASCRHSWHQNPEDPDELILADESSEPPPAEEEPVAELSSAAVRETEAVALPDPTADEVDPRVEASDMVTDGPDRIAPARDGDETPTARPAHEDDFTPFATGGADEPKRRSGVFGVLIAIVVVALAALAFWYFAPAEWKARVGLAEATETPLQLMMTHSDRQPLASGNELLAISGRVINPTQQSQSVPPITAQLRDDAGKLVYSWTIAPPTPSLKGGDSAPFYSAEVNVPAGGNELTVTLGTPKA
jgi:predicted Zn finger-like uncharacterized protein